MISPGWFTDFSNKGHQAFRLPWHVVSYYNLNGDWHWVTGVTDLARDDIRILPVLGTVYAPVGGNVRLDLVFPKPRFLVHHSIGSFVRCGHVSRLSTRRGSGNAMGWRWSNPLGNRLDFQPRRSIPFWHWQLRPTRQRDDPNFFRLLKQRNCPTQRVRLLSVMIRISSDY